MAETYILQNLPYEYGALAPVISEEQLKLHHQKHHNSYIVNANALLKKIMDARKNNSEISIKHSTKDLTFNIAGHILHSLFWESLRKPRQANEPNGEILKAINLEFGSFERFKKEFSDAALSTEGSGWAVLMQDKKTKNILICQIEKHHVNLIPEMNILLVLDVWEHAYYLDYKNERAKYIENFWQIVNWDEVSNRLKDKNNSMKGGKK